MDLKDIKYIALSEILTEYKEKNKDNKYKPAAVGRYGVRDRESVYNKELAKDYSKNKVIYKDTLTLGMGSVQMDIGILVDDVTYSVSPAYHTFRINTDIVDSEYLKYSLEFFNKEMFVFLSTYPDRLISLAQKLNLEDRIMNGINYNIQELLNNKVDWDKVNYNLTKERNKSLSWLMSSLEEGVYNEEK